MWRAASFALCFLSSVILTPVAIAEPVVLVSTDGFISVEGELMDFDDNFYLVKTSVGEVRIPVSDVRCEGAACPAPRQIRVVVGTDWAPFTDESQEQGGMMTEVTNVALSYAEGTPEYKIDFINDWGAHLQPLISDHAYDFSIAWFKPNCAVVERLSDDSKFRCNNLDWSAPLFEQNIGYYTRADHPRLVTYKDLFGLTVCRPSGYATFMMEENNLVEPNIVFKRPGKTTDCFQGLVDGTYDAVVLASDTAEGAINEIGAKDKVAFHEHLSQVATMHAVISKTNPRGKEFLAALDSGIRKIKQTGEWFQIVARHMAQHRAKTQ